MKGKAPARAAVAYPGWHDKLLERCRTHAAHPDFPTADLARLFSTRDQNGRDLPSRELVNFVQIQFGGSADATGKPPPAEALVGAESLVRLALQRHVSMLSSVEQAQLKSARALLLKRMAYGPHGRLTDQERALAGVNLLREAAGQLSGVGPESLLRRHFLWLAIDLLTQTSQASAQEGAIAQMLKEALSGPARRATLGLYYGCASRLFGRLRDETIHDVLQAVAEDLLNAWSRVPAAIQLPRQEEGVIPERGFTFSEIIPKQALAALGGAEHAAPATTEGTVSFGAEQLQWQPLDRFGLCVMLHRCLSGTPVSALFLAEALKLRSRPEVSQEPNVAEMLAYVDHSVPSNEADCHDDNDCPAAKEVRELLVAGKLHEAIRLGQQKLDEAADGVEFGTVAIEVARALGDSISADAEGGLLEKALGRVERVASQEEALVRGQLHRAKAIHLWHTVGGESALEELEEALNWAARAGCRRLVLECHRAEYEILDKLGRPRSPREVNGFVLSFVNLWGRIEWTEYLVTDRCKPKWSDVLDEGTRRNMRLLREHVHHRDWFRTNESTAREIMAILRRNTHTEEPLVLAETWAEFFKGVQKTQSANGSAPFDLTTEAAEQLASTCAFKLKGLRSVGTQIDNAFLLGEWALRHSESIPATVRDLIATCIRAAIVVQIEQLKRTRLKSYLAGSRWNLVRLVSLLTGIAGWSGLQADECLRWVNFCKAMDADDEQTTQEKKTNGRSADVPGLKVEELTGPVPEDETAGEDRELDLSGLRQVLGPEEAALVDFFLGAADAESFAVVVDPRQSRLIPLAINITTFNKNYLARILKCARAFLPKKRREDPLSLQRAFTLLRNNLSSSAFAEILSEAESVLNEIGKALLPAALRNEVAPYRLLYVVPHSRLFGLPLHLLRSETGKTLVESHEVLFLPKARYLEPQGDGERLHRKSDFLCANVEDELLATHAQQFVRLVPTASNAWFAKARPEALLEQVARAKVAYFFVHGHHTWTQPWLTRLALRDGVRLTAGHVKRAPVSFSGTEIQLFACHSGHAQAKRAYEMLGLASPFLGKHADSVLACLWPPLVSDALGIAESMIAQRKGGATRAGAFRKALNVMMAGHGAFESLLRFGCFTLYGRNSQEG
ncbi:MAG: CHAT domain-containing protein [Verrucomicrobia bacterium]|nr:CHAT domain-containing protein [Verrucomicrobiota bacterium]